MKRTIAERVHAYLVEPDGELFRNNKWRFWWPTVAGFALVNAVLTAAIFRDGDALQDFMGVLMVTVAGIVCWLSVCGLHYSDAPDRRLARGVAGLDSAALVFVVLHFAVCMWVFGHLHVLRGAERKYEQQVAAFNAEAKQVSGDSVKIAQSAENIAKEQTKRAKLENDSAYQLRRAAEAGGARGVPRSGSAPAPGAATPALTTAQIQLAAPVKLEKSSVAFLAEWDSVIRALNFGELLLSVLTLILIRNRSAKTNTPRSPDMNFGSSLSITARTPTPAPTFRKTHASYEQEKTQKTHASYDTEGLKRLREALRDVSFRLRGRCFKVDVRGDAVWVRMVKANNSTQETIHSAKAKLSILNDAMIMPREAFRERLERFLKSNGFEI